MPLSETETPAHRENGKAAGLEVAVVLLLVAVGALLAWAFWLGLAAGLEGGAAGERLAPVAAARVPESGVSNPVTAVLLNFRGYDTLLELSLLLAALLGIWSSGRAAPGFCPPGAVLEGLAVWLVPLLILAAGYLLWAGAHAPGGAFQAGALLGAAGVTLRLAGHDRAGLPAPNRVRILAGAGVLVFVLVGLALAAFGGGFLSFPPELAKWLILLIESAATLAVGATLAAAYLGGEPLDTGAGEAAAGTHARPRPDAAVALGSARTPTEPAP